MHFARVNLYDKEKEYRMIIMERNIWKWGGILIVSMMVLSLQWHSGQGPLAGTKVLYEGASVQRTLREKPTATKERDVSFEKDFSQVAWWNSEYPYRIKASVDSGMYERKDLLVSVSINFGRFFQNTKLLDPNSVRVIDCESAKEVPFLFEVDDKNPNQGMVDWLMRSKIEPLVEKHYFIYFDSKRGRPKKKVYYPALRRIDKGGNLVSNPGFENDGQWFLRSHPDKKALSRFADEQTHSGKRHFMISNNDPETINNGCYSNIFAIRPNTRYTLSGWLRIEEIPLNPDGYGLIQLSFLDEQKKQRRPPKEKNYRILLGQAVDPARVEKEDFLGKWVRRTKTGISPRWARYGRIKVYAYRFIGTVYFDDISLKEIRPEPPTVTLSEFESRVDNI